MDWHAWLSAARLEPALVYEYALVFARNELEADDVAYFDHEFLHSMGISVAKHRLEILKLARRDRARSLSRLLDRVARYVRSLVRLEESTVLVLDPSQHQPDYPKRGSKALRRAAKSEPKGSTPKATIRGRGAAAVHAVRDVDNGAGGGGDSDEMVRWDRLFQDLKPN
ncbi:uncharacterized protein LOC133889106 [Phragmites australis]|uniref:uncharacterized protein LOC133889106 n=1 Tax=Phragmites australis TaxID=29695 RepID=UPI002D785B4F|nr:uncharacterized protein LOC133889106 [Phragmites australis]